jgi:rRNA biogenesis protein RRP5
VPITNITSQLTTSLESMAEEDHEMHSDESDDDDGQSSKRRIPELFEIFHPGQYVRAVVTAVHAPGSTDTSGFGKTRDESYKASSRVELSLFPEKVNEGVAKVDVRAGFVSISATVILLRGLIFVRLALPL